LMLRAFAGLLRKNPGFETTHVLTLSATVASARYPNGTAVRRFLEPTLDAVRQVPGVQSAGGINLVPYVNWGWNSNIRYEGASADDPTRWPLVEQRVVTPSFFSMGGCSCLTTMTARRRRKWPSSTRRSPSATSTARTRWAAGSTCPIP